MNNRSVVVWMLVVLTILFSLYVYAVGRWLYWW